MLRTIMVPLDGSRTAESAIPWAVHLSRQTNSAIKMVRVNFPPTPMVGGDGLASGDPGIYDEIRKLEWEYMSNISDSFVQRGNSLNVTAELLDADDSAAGVLAKFAASQQVDLTVMTSHGRGPFTRFWLGSVTDEFLRLSEGPTLIVRAKQDDAPATTPGQIKRVLIPLDGSKLSEYILKPATAIGELFATEFVLLLVLDAVENIRELLGRVSGPASQLLAPESALGVAQEYLERMAKKIRREGRIVRTQVIERGAAAEAILAEASLPKALICLATHGHGGLTRMIFGSVADKVVRGATGPVLIVRPHQSE